MIQELLVGGGGGGGARMLEKCMIMGEQRKAPPEVVAADGQQAGLRCPRCDSTNTKFCYYNNYNLTQPRHFCKSCRRYWTQGGALRNVPIGGGCRKNKSSGGRSGKSKPECTSTNSKPAMTTTTTATTTASTINSGLSDHEPTSSSSAATATTSPSILAPQTSSSISSFLQNAQFFESHNYLGFLKPGNPNSPMMLQRSVSEAQNIDAMSLFNGGGMWRNGNHHYHQPPLLQNQQQQQQNQLGLVGDQSGVFGSSGGGIQELYHRLKAISGCYGSEEQHHRVQPLLSGSWGVESTPLAVGDLGLWGSSLPWSDLQSAAGASFP